MGLLLEVTIALPHLWLVTVTLLASFPPWVAYRLPFFPFFVWRYLVDVLARIDQQVKENPIIIYMKGTPQMPMCGFSSRASQALANCGVDFAYVNVLADPEIFQNLPRYQNWPTFPQVYVNGELIGGCDITLELMQKGELKPMLEAAVQARGAA
jgi:monothiol glutaredoxin